MRACVEVQYLYGPWSSLLEGTAVDTLVEVDGVLARYDIFQGATLASLFQTMWCERYGGWEGRGGRTLFLPLVAAGACRGFAKDDEHKGHCLQYVVAAEGAMWPPRRLDLDYDYGQTDGEKLGDMKYPRLPPHEMEFSSHHFISYLW
jgi:hypothetical protein